MLSVPARAFPPGALSERLSPNSLCRHLITSPGFQERAAQIHRGGRVTSLRTALDTTGGRSDPRAQARQHLFDPKYLYPSCCCSCDNVQMRSLAGLQGRTASGKLRQEQNVHEDNHVLLSHLMECALSPALVFPEFVPALFSEEFKTPGDLTS